MSVELDLVAYQKIKFYTFGSLFFVEDLTDLLYGPGFYSRYMPEMLWYLNYLFAFPYEVRDHGMVFKCSNVSRQFYYTCLIRRC